MAEHPLYEAKFDDSIAWNTVEPQSSEIDRVVACQDGDGENFVVSLKKESTTLPDLPGLHGNLDLRLQEAQSEIVRLVSRLQEKDEMIKRLQETNKTFIEKMRDLEEVQGHAKIRISWLQEQNSLLQRSVTLLEAKVEQNCLRRRVACEDVSIKGSQSVGGTRDTTVSNQVFQQPGPRNCSVLLNRVDAPGNKKLQPQDIGSVHNLDLSTGDIDDDVPPSYVNTSQHQSENVGSVNSLHLSTGIMETNCETASLDENDVETLSNCSDSHKQADVKSHPINNITQADAKSIESAEVRSNKVNKRQSRDCITNSIMEENSLNITGDDVRQTLPSKPIQCTKKPLESCQVCGKKVRYLNEHMRVTHLNSKQYKCGVCGFRYLTEEELLEHKKVHAGKKPVNCDLCGKTLIGRHAVPDHMKTHTGEAPFKCDICGFRFKRKGKLTGHRKLHFKPIKPKVLIKCEICHKQFATRQGLKNHKLTHRFDCDFCGKTFTRLHHLSKHLDNHINKLILQCDICLKMYTSQQFLNNKHVCSKCPICGKFVSDLNKHLLIHNQEKHKCRTCGESFERISAYRKHVWAHEGRETYKFMCHICGKAFADRSSLESHTASHLDIRAYKCEVCGKAFVERINLKRHQRVMHSDVKPYVCNVCGQSFPRGDYLTTHVKNHHTKERYTCDVCGKSFTTRLALERHVMIGLHTRENKTLQCRLCGKILKSRRTLLNHLEYTHSDKKPFQCDLCEKSYKSKNKLKAHKQLKHPSNNAIEDIARQVTVVDDIDTV